MSVTVEELIDADEPEQLEKQEPAQFETTREAAGAPDYVQPYKYKACEHGMWIPEWPRLYVAVRCPLCFPEGPANCDASEYGDYIQFGFLPQILTAVKKRGYIQTRGNIPRRGGTKPGGAQDDENVPHYGTNEVDLPFGVVLERAMSTGYFIRHDAKEDLIVSCRMKIMAKREIITKRAETLGWTTPAMKAYIRTLCEHHIMDEQGYRALRLPFPQLHEDLTAEDVKPWVEKLPAELRQAFKARYRLNDGPGLVTNSWKRTAEILGVDASKARRRVAAAIRMMIKQVEG